MNCQQKSTADKEGSIVYNLSIITVHKKIIFMLHKTSTLNRRNL